LGATTTARTTFDGAPNSSTHRKYHSNDLWKRGGVSISPRRKSPERQDHHFGYYNSVHQPRRLADIDN
jgi:hypothetical protein